MIGGKRVCGMKITVVVHAVVVHAFGTAQTRGTVLYANHHQPSSTITTALPQLNRTILSRPCPLSQAHRGRWPAARPPLRGHGSQPRTRVTNQASPPQTWILDHTVELGNLLGSPGRPGRRRLVLRLQRLHRGSKRQLAQRLRGPQQLFQGARVAAAIIVPLRFGQRQSWEEKRNRDERRGEIIRGDKRR